MAVNFSKWNSTFDAKSMVAEVAELDKNGGNGQTYVDVPEGTYEVKVAKLELRESKKGDPMFTAQFKILNGQYKNQSIWMNQIIVQPFQIHKVNDMLRDLLADLQNTPEVRFDGDYGHYNSLIMDVAEAIDKKLEYALKYSTNSKGYKEFEIEEVFDAGELPF